MNRNSWVILRTILWIGLVAGTLDITENLVFSQLRGGHAVESFSIHRQRIDWNELLYDLGVMGWFMLVTIPGGVFAFIFWLIALILHRATWRRRLLGHFPSSSVV